MQQYSSAIPGEPDTPETREKRFQRIQKDMFDTIIDLGFANAQEEILTQNREHQKIDAEYTQRVRKAFSQGVASGVAQSAHQRRLPNMPMSAECDDPEYQV